MRSMFDRSDHLAVVAKGRVKEKWELKRKRKSERVRN